MQETYRIRRRPTRVELVLAAIAVVLMVWGWWWAHDQNLPAVEKSVFEWVNGWPDWVRFPLWPVMQLGNGLVWVVAPVITFLVWRRRRVAAAVFLATFSAWLGAKIVKDVVERGRPDVFLDSADLRQTAPDGFGFISGHTAIAFALATVLRPYLPPRWRPPAWVLVALVGVARMFFGVHLPADVLGGAGFGIACGLAANAALGIDESVGTRTRAAERS